MDIRTEQDEAAFLRDYDPRSFDPVAVSVDVVVLTIKDGRLCALLVKRERPPFAGWWALPGSFLRPDETASIAAGRAVAAKTNVKPSHFEQLYTYTQPDRDPRMRVVSVAYLAFSPIADEPSAGYHTTEAEWVPVFDNPIDMGFDHQRILDFGVHRAQDKLEYTTLATTFLPDEFTVGQLMKVYEAVWGKPVSKGNFYRKAKASPGFIEWTGGHLGGKAQKAGSGSASSKIFRAGPAKMLYPPIRREGGEWA